MAGWLHGDRCGRSTTRKRGKVKNRPTVRNVAEVAGVSFKAVSRVINDEPGVRPATAEREHHIIESFVAQRLRGLLIVPIGRDHRYLAREMRLGTAIVFLDRPQRHLRADTVLLDDYGGAHTATEHLMAHGHRRIAVVSQSLDMHTMSERFRGYHEAMADAGIEIDATLIRNDLKDARDARAVVSAMLEGDDPPTAIFCANNRMSVGAIGALRDIRSQVAVVGFDDLELADALAVPLTVVYTDAAALGKAGAELLMKRMDGWSEPPQKIVLPTTLIERGSGEISPA